MCGGEGTGLAFETWVRATFTDHDKLLPGEIICQACQFCCDESSSLLQNLAQKDKPQRMRNYSHFVVEGKWIPLSKGDKARMTELLCQNPEVAVIALSGQKHLIFRAPAGWWLFEEQQLPPAPDLLARLLIPITALYTAGATKAEIGRGIYTQRAISRIGIPHFQALEAQCKRYRSGTLFELAVFLAQREESDDT